MVVGFAVAEPLVQDVIANAAQELNDVGVWDLPNARSAMGRDKR